MELPRMENRAMTFDEASMERSKSFIKALQELKNLRPQLYSAAEYCEKSYLHSEQKQMLPLIPPTAEKKIRVLDNLKDYTVRSLVNAIDHLGTVAYKLTDLLEQQSLDITVMGLKVTSINQQFLTCQTYTDSEGIRQQQLLAIIPRHHKHYILPNSVNKKVHFSPQIQTDARNKLQARSRLQPSGAPSARTLSWHLASETKSSMKGSQHSLTSPEASGRMQVFQLLSDEDSNHSRSLVAPPQLRSGVFSSGSSAPPHGASRRDSVDGSKSMTAFGTFDNRTHNNNMAIIRAPARSRSMLSAFFAKPKTPRLTA